MYIKSATGSYRETCRGHKARRWVWQKRGGVASKKIPTPKTLYPQSYVKFWSIRFCCPLRCTLALVAAHVCTNVIGMKFGRCNSWQRRALPSCERTGIRELLQGPHFTFVIWSAACFETRMVASHMPFTGQLCLGTSQSWSGALTLP